MKYLKRFYENNSDDLKNIRLRNPLNHYKDIYNELVEEFKVPLEDIVEGLHDETGINFKISHGVVNSEDFRFDAPFKIYLNADYSKAGLSLRSKVNINVSYDLDSLESLDKYARQLEVINNEMQTLKGYLDYEGLKMKFENFSNVSYGDNLSKIFDHTIQAYVDIEIEKEKYMEYVLKAYAIEKKELEERIHKAKKDALKTLSLYKKDHDITIDDIYVIHKNIEEFHIIIKENGNTHDIGIHNIYSDSGTVYDIAQIKKLLNIK